MKQVILRSGATSEIQEYQASRGFQKAKEKSNMNKQNWLTLIASAILVTGVPGQGVAQMQGPESQIAGSEQAQRAIREARYPHGPRLMPPLQQKPISLADLGSQLSGRQADSGAEAAANTADFITFDVPGSSCAPPFPRCTTPVAINPAGTVTGYYADANAALHGFLRDRDGTFTNFDGPGATCPSFFSICTLPAGINPAGAITGFYCDAVTCHGFLRDRDGTFTTLDPPSSLFTQANSINPAGAITGSYCDAVTCYGFLRDPDGTFSTFNAPGAFYGTAPQSINPAGAITGVYYDVNFTSHGFLRAPDGTFTAAPIDPAGSIYTNPVGIDPAGAVTGYYQDASYVLHGFLRNPTGSFTTFVGPGSTQTYPSGINPAGAITGDYVRPGTPFSGFHGFLRARDGTFNPFDPPGSIDTFALGINPAGAITGWYIDPGFLGHGFGRKPQGK